MTSNLKTAKSLNGTQKRLLSSIKALKVLMGGVLELLL